MIPEKQTPMKIRVGGVHVSIWRNTNADGKEWTSVSVQRVYKDSDGLWKNTTYMRPNDIPKLVLALQKAYEDINLRDGDLAQA